MRRRILLCASVLAAGATPAVAQESSSARQEAPRPIIVTGRGLQDPQSAPTYATVALEREEIATSASGRIEDVLSQVAGFQQFRRSDSRSANPSAQGVTLRSLGGNASSRALVLLDGVPIAHPFFGYVPLSAIDPQRISSIAVTRGGGSGAFGTGAVAGTIEMQSASAREIGPALASALVNDRGETELSGLASAELGAGYALIGARWDRGQGFFTTPVDQREPASARAAFDAKSLFLRAVAPLTPDVELQAAGLVFGDERTLRFDGADSTSRGADASLRVVGRGEWQFDALAYVQARNFSNIVISSSRFTRVLDQRDTPSTGLGGKLELRPPTGEATTLRIGTDLRIADGRIEEDAYSAFSGNLTERRSGGGRTSNLGLFAEVDHVFGPLIISGGARADRWTVRDGFYRVVLPDGTVDTHNRFADRSGWDASFRGGALLQVSPVLAMRAAGYTGLRLPTLNELYRPFVIFPVVTEANAALENERIEGFEAGLDWSPVQGIDLSLTAFQNRLKNAIANVTLTPVLRQRRNLDAVRARGIEADARMQLGAFSLQGSLALTDAQVEASGEAAALDGLRPAQVSEVIGSATLAWVPQAGWRLATTLRHTGKAFEDDRESDVLPATTTLDAYAELPLTRALALVLRGENLTDERIVTRNQAGSIDLGTPRTFWAGIKLRLGQ